MSTRNGCTILPGMYQRTTAVWEGRGATARPWEAKWSSGVAAVFWGVCKTSIVLDVRHQQLLLTIQIRESIYHSSSSWDKSL